MTMSELLEKFPPRCRIVLSDHKVHLSLETAVAIGDNAAAVAREFLEERRKRFNESLTAARQRFLESPQWQSVAMLRDRVALMASEAAAATAKLSELRMQYQGALLAGDPVSLLPTLSAQQTEVESRRRALDDFERQHVKAAEDAAALELRRRIDDAQAKLRSDARAEYIRQLAELVASIGTDKLLSLAVAENVALSAAMLPMPSARGAVSVGEYGEYATLPERGFTIQRDSSAPPAAATCGPSPVEYSDNRPLQWGPSEQRVS